MGAAQDAPRHRQYFVLVWDASLLAAHPAARQARLEEKKFEGKEVGRLRKNRELRLTGDFRRSYNSHRFLSCSFSCSGFPEQVARRASRVQFLLRDTLSTMFAIDSI